VSASYGWRPVAPPDVGSFSIRVADALASYFMCDRGDLNDNCQLSRRDLQALKMLQAAVGNTTDDQEDVGEIIAAIELHGAVELVVSR
jgi:hypothetical protein